LLSSDEAGARRRTGSQSLLTSGERMLVGRGRIAGDCTPAKPQWSEVMIFWNLILRQKVSCPEEPSNFDEHTVYQRITINEENKKHFPIC
jgi:hypothetical protein